MTTPPVGPGPFLLSGDEDADRLTFPLSSELGDLAGCRRREEVGDDDGEEA